MVFFKRLSRPSRSSSYVDDGYDEASSPQSTHPPVKFNRYNSQDDSRPGSQQRDQNQHNLHSSQHDVSFQQEKPYSSPPGSAGQDMYRSSHNGPSQDMYSHQQVQSGSRAVSGAQTIGSVQQSNGGNNVSSSHPALTSKLEVAPDLLTRAFNEAVRPYTERIEQLEAELADMRAQLDNAEGDRDELRNYLDTVEGERREIFGWIDKRGLRPDVPPTIARAMDASNPEAAHLAATTLSAQLDRKITIVNFDLHRLQDDLNDSISTAHFAASMLKFLPDIQRLASLPTGPRHAFDLVLKLGGNLNSHGGLDDSAAGPDGDNAAARQAFFAKLDDALSAVVQRRFDEEGQEWGVQKEIRRLEKTREYLRQFGVEPYFPRSLDIMKREAGPAAAGGMGMGVGGGYHSDTVGSANASQQHFGQVPVAANATTTTTTTNSATTATGPGTGMNGQGGGLAQQANGSPPKY